MKKLFFAFSIFSATVTSPAFAQPIDRPFSDQRGCTSGSTSVTGGRKSCSGEFAWPDQPSETPNTPWAITPDSVKLEKLDERGTGSGCFISRYDYEQRTVPLPDIGQEVVVNIPIRIVVSYNARGGSGAGERGRIECKITGSYRSQ